MRATMTTTTTTTGMGMYSMRPVVILPAKCPGFTGMYEMRKIHGDGQRRCHDAADTADEAETPTPDDIVTQVNRLLQASLPDYKALEARQEKILAQLAELKNQVSNLCRYLKQSKKIELTKDFVAIQREMPVSINVLLNVNPRKPPYSILALQKLWKDTTFRIKSYSHSTISDPIPIVFPDIVKCCTTNIVDLTLIWKEVPNMEVFIDIHSCVIKGEANFLRYVSRLIESHNYESTCLQPHTLDFALDFTNLLHYERCIEKGLLVLAHEFEKWSCKGGFNIVDIAVWSLIKQFPGTNLPPTLRKWYALCESTFIGKNVDSLIH